MSVQSQEPGYGDETMQNDSHRRGRIQAQGCLLAWREGSTQIGWASANLDDYLGCAAEEALGASLDVALGEEAARAVASALEDARERPQQLGLRCRERDLAGRLVSGAGVVALELTRIGEPRPKALEALLEVYVRSLDQEPCDLSRSAALLATEVRERFRFDRVRCTHLERGSAASPQLLFDTSPAGEEPARWSLDEAPRLRARLVTDSEHAGVEVLAAEGVAAEGLAAEGLAAEGLAAEGVGGPLSALPLELAAPSEEELEFLAGVGARSALWIPLALGDYGTATLCCTARAPLRFGCFERLVLELGGVLFSHVVSHGISARVSRAREQARPRYSELIGGALGADDLAAGLARVMIPLAELLAAEGALVAGPKGALASAGRLPGDVTLTRILSRLREGRAEARWVHAEDAHARPPLAAGWSGGLLAAPIDGQGRHWALWFRRRGRWSNAERSLARDLCEVGLHPVLLAYAGRASATRRLVRSNRELEDFAHVVAHDLKAPLRHASNLVHFIAEDCGPVLGQRGHAHLKHLLGRLSYMQTMIEGVFAYARSSQQGAVSQSLDAGEVVREVARSLQIPADKRLIVQDDLPVLSFSRVQLQQVFANLISNAVKYGGSTIEVRHRVEAGEVVLEVSDDGPGIAPEDRQQIFKLFRRGAHQGEVVGTGVGLAVVAKIARDHGGSVRVDERPGGGATFSVRLPRPEAAAKPKGRRLLVVEDDRAAAELLSAVLVSMGHSVEVGHDCQSALALASAKEFDLVFVDLILPDGSGFGLVEPLRKLLSPATVFVALTGLTPERARARAERAGFHHFVSKPADVDLLADVISLSCA